MNQQNQNKYKLITQEAQQLIELKQDEDFQIKMFLNEQTLEKIDNFKDKKVKAICMLGDTGEGKSTFGNILIHSLIKDLDKGYQFFKSSQGQESCTQGIQIACLEADDHILIILDCEGLNSIFMQQSINEQQLKQRKDGQKSLVHIGYIFSSCMILMKKGAKANESVQDLMKTLLNCKYEYQSINKDQKYKVLCQVDLQSDNQIQIIKEQVGRANQGDPILENLRNYLVLFDKQMYFKRVFKEDPFEDFKYIIDEHQIGKELNMYLEHILKNDSANPFLENQINDAESFTFNLRELVQNKNNNQRFSFTILQQKLAQDYFKKYQAKIQSIGEKIQNDFKKYMNLFSQQGFSICQKEIHQSIYNLYNQQFIKDLKEKKQQHDKINFENLSDQILINKSDQQEEQKNQQIQQKSNQQVQQAQLEVQLSLINNLYQMNDRPIEFNFLDSKQFDTQSIQDFETNSKYYQEVLKVDTGKKSILITDNNGKEYLYNYKSDTEELTFKIYENYDNKESQFKAIGEKQTLKPGDDKFLHLDQNLTNNQQSSLDRLLNSEKSIQAFSILGTVLGGLCSNTIQGKYKNNAKQALIDGGVGLGVSSIVITAARKFPNIGPALAVISFVYQGNSIFKNQYLSRNLKSKQFKQLCKDVGMQTGIGMTGAFIGGLIFTPLCVPWLGAFLGGFTGGYLANFFSNFTKKSMNEIIAEINWTLFEQWIQEKNWNENEIIHFIKLLTVDKQKFEELNKKININKLEKTYFNYFNNQEIKDEDRQKTQNLNQQEIMMIITYHVLGYYSDSLSQKNLLKYEEREKAIDNILKFLNDEGIQDNDILIYKFEIYYTWAQNFECFQQNNKSIAQYFENGNLKYTPQFKEQILNLKNGEDQVLFQCMPQYFEGKTDIWIALLSIQALDNSYAITLAIQQLYLVLESRNICVVDYLQQFQEILEILKSNFIV